MARHFTLHLRKILLSNIFYGSFFLLSVCFALFMQTKKQNPPSVKPTKVYQGTVTFKQATLDALIFETKGPIFFRVYVPLEKDEQAFLDENITIGSKIAFQGDIQLIQDKTSSFYRSSYQKRMERKKIFYQIKVTNIKKIKQTSFLDGLKEKIYQTIETRFQTSAYLKTFLVGDQSELPKEIKQNYQTLGISHLFALSGMHISFLVGGLYILLQKGLKSSKISFYLALVFLTLYYLLVKQSPSILRACLFFVLFKGNQLYDLHIAPYQILLFLLSLFLFFNPFIFEEVSFLYSFSIASGLILYGKHLQGKTKIKTLLKSSLFSFFISLPITLYYQHQLNPFSILFNLFYIPFVSSILFPLSFLVFLFPFLEPLYFLCIQFLEFSSAFCLKISPLFVFQRLSLLYYLVLFFLFLLSLFYKKGFLLYGIMLLFPLFLPFLKQDTLTMLDVGQGDCFLFESQGKALLLDTGGTEGQEISEQDASFLIEELKARGISKVQVLLSHGDLDHAGNLIDLIKHFQVTFIGLNLGELSFLEKEVIKLADQENIPYQIMDKGNTLRLGNFQFLEINEEWENENDSSSVYFVTHQEKAMLFLGDASQKVEEKLLKQYEFPTLSILKVGHHGSRTSTSDLLLQEKIEMALISVGRDNRYHHPSEEVIEKLKKKKIKIYQTSEKGCVEIQFPQLNCKTSLVPSSKAMIQ